MQLIFDLDGTLFQTAEIEMTAVKALFEELGLPQPEARAVVKHIGKTMPQFMTAILPGEYVTAAVAARFHALENAAVVNSGRVFACVDELLRTLSGEGHCLNICSNGSEDYIHLVLSATGIEGYFNGIYSAKAVGSKAEKLREILSLDPNTPAVMIGDTREDLTAAAENSIPSVAALYGYGGLLPSEGSAAAQSPADILACIRRLHVFTEIKRRLVDTGRRIIGINGVDTAGKTEFSEGLARYLRSVGQKCMVVHMDDFHNPLALRRQGHDQIDSYYRNAFNYRQLIDELLEPLQAQGQIDKDVLCLNVETDCYEINRHFKVDKDTVILIEGVLLFRPPVLDYLDGTVFLEISFDKVLDHARVRDVPRYGEEFLQKYSDRYIPVQKRYLEEHKPHEICDVLFDNNDYDNPMLLVR